MVSRLKSVLRVLKTTKLTETSEKTNAIGLEIISLERQVLNLSVSFSLLVKFSRGFDLKFT